MESLVESNEICKALYYNDEDFESKESLEEPYILFYNKIYPYLFVPEPESEKGSYITFTFRDYKLSTNTFKFGTLFITAIVHKDLMRTKSGWLRSDYLLSHIDMKLNQMRGIGIGRLEFSGMDDIVLPDDYYGGCIEYKIYELN